MSIVFVLFFGVGCWIFGFKKPMRWDGTMEKDRFLHFLVFVGEEVTTRFTIMSFLELINTIQNHQGPKVSHAYVLPYRAYEYRERV